jgi:PAS domain-containing protein
MSVFDVLGSHDPANPVIARHRAALSGESQSFEYLFFGRWYAIFIEQLLDDHSSGAGCIASAFDITEQRATKERLARSEALLAQAQRMAHIGSFEWDIASGVVSWSDELHRIYGLKPGEFEGNYEAYLKHVDPNDSNALRVPSSTPCVRADLFSMTIGLFVLTGVCAFCERAAT